MMNLLKKIDWAAVVVLFGVLLAAEFDNPLAAFMWLSGSVIGSLWCIYVAKKAKGDNEVDRNT